ncbi:MAG TPA: protein phosphatase 2C domain-containing protein, partial [Terrimesophilobacter sp.]|nr:protein phosphatase 2C domain-containing protein [Terrimesophilobacter sp.]
PVFAVADGMGGHSAGDVASDAVVTRLSELESDVVQPSDIAAALGRATVDLVSAVDDAGLGVGTTVTGAALTLVDDVLTWAVFNIGDSRTYLFEAFALEQVTRDHSVVQELISAGLLDAKDAETHPDANVITRAVGFGGSPILDVWLVPVRAGARLLMCSDGLTRELGDPHIRERLSDGLSPFDTATVLRDDALVSGGRDNVTAVIVDVA